jgi:hypothetical protein
VSERGLSVRETENLVRKAQGEGGQPAKRPELSAISEVLRTKTVRVRLRLKSNGSSRLIVDVKDSEKRDAILEAIKKVAE